MAEIELLALLEDQPNDAAIAFQFGSSIVSGRDTNCYPAAIYYLARAATATSPGALSPTGKQTTEDCHSPLKVSLTAGTEIEFTGVPESFAREPFMVVFSQVKQKRLP